MGSISFGPRVRKFPVTLHHGQHVFQGVHGELANEPVGLHYNLRRFPKAEHGNAVMQSSDYKVRGMHLSSRGRLTNQTSVTYLDMRFSLHTDYYI
jgi:hypothetical protein